MSTEDRLKCSRCRWVGTHSELQKKPSIRIQGLSDNVCPRCGCKTFTKKESNNG